MGNSGLGLALGAGLVYLMLKKGNGSSDSVVSTPPPETIHTFHKVYKTKLRNIKYVYQLADQDPLAPDEPTVKTDFISKKTGKITLGMYTRPAHLKLRSKDIWIK